MSRGTRNYCFTLNNYSEEDEVNLKSIPTEGDQEVKYIVYGREIGEEEKTPHLQGFVMFKNAKTMAACIGYFGRILGHPRTHLEQARGTPFEASQYCKKDGDYYSSGLPPLETHTKTSAADRAERNLKLLEENKVAELRRLDPVWFVANCTKFNLLGNLCRTAPQDLSGPCGFWISGRAGVGKSTFARSLMARHGYATYVKPHNKWWDGYQQEPGVIWDEFSPNDATFFTQFLKLWMDQYATRVEAKNGGFWIRPRAFIITSNYRFEEVFGHLSVNDFQALKRRLKYHIEDFDRECIDQYLEYRFD